MAKRRGMRRREGLLPGEYRRKSLVTVDVGLLDKPGEELHHYVVLTHRQDGDWSARVEFQGEIWKLPGKVVDALISQREAIIKEHRRRLAQDRVLTQADAIVRKGG